MNVMHSSMEITNQFYSNLNDNEIQDRISRLGISPEQNGVSAENIDALISVLQSLKAGTPPCGVNSDPGRAK
jgi:hypothetical protein